jgi:hypothetical protein
MSRSRSARSGYIPLYEPVAGSAAYYGQMYPQSRGSRSVRRSVSSRSATSPFVYNYSPAPGGAVLVPIFQAENGQFYAGVTPESYGNPYSDYLPYEENPHELQRAGFRGALMYSRGYQEGRNWSPLIPKAQAAFRSQYAASRLAQGGAAAGAGGGAPVGHYLMPSISNGSRGSRGSKGSKGSKGSNRKRAGAAGGAAGLLPSRSR